VDHPNSIVWARTDIWCGDSRLVYTASTHDLDARKDMVMADVEQESLADDDEFSEEGSEGGPSATPVAKSFQEMATRNVSRARKSFTRGDGEENTLGAYTMQAAIVYAILDLADAVRSNQGL
jgi:hypothetical protein